MYFVFFHTPRRGYTFTSHAVFHSKKVKHFILYNILKILAILISPWQGQQMASAT